jgi:hypothetical protein
MKQSFYGGKKGYDIVCFDNQGKIQCSGKKKKMLEYAGKWNWAVAKLIPIRFSKPTSNK